MVSKQVKIVEVGPRDGLQNEPTLISTQTKLDFIRKLADAGLTQIEVTSFVHPKAIPQLADALDLVRNLEPRSGVTYSALVPNMKGLERAIEAGIPRIAVFTAASEAFTQKNINMTLAESLKVFQPVVRQALERGISVRGYVSTAFYCPYAGKIDVGATINVTHQLLDMGIDEVSIGDTIGQATPDDVQFVVSRMLGEFPREQLAMHFHDTNGLALENVEAALELGIETFDASAGGLGGCPYAPGASGNLSTNDLVAMLDARNVKTGVNLAKLNEAAAIILSLTNQTDDLLQDADTDPFSRITNGCGADGT